MSASNSKLTLIANPRNFAERENNKAYYQAKFFSKSQKESLKEKKRKEEIARKEIAKRQEFGENGGLSFRHTLSKGKQEENWKYMKERLKIYHESMNEGRTQTDDPVVPTDEGKCIDAVLPPSEIRAVVAIEPLSAEVVDSWEDL